MPNGHGPVYLGGSLWTIDFTINGRRVREGIGTNKRQAEMVLAKRMAEAIEGRYFSKRNLGLMPFKELADKYLKEVVPLMRSVRSETIRVRRWVRDLGSRPLGQITRAELETWQREMRLKCKPSTVNHELGRLRHVLNRAVDWGLLEENPMKGLKFLRENNARQRFLSLEECERLIQACISLRVRAIVVMALHTAMRLGEILNLRCDLDFRSGLILIPDSKNGEPRHVAILERAPASPMRLNPDLPPRLEDIINQALEKDRELRYQHASDLRAELQRLKRDAETGRAASAGSGTGVAAAQDASSQVTAQQPAPISGSGVAALSSGSTKVAEVPARSGKLRKLLIPTALLLIAAIAIGVFYFRSQHAAKLSEKDTLVLADFTNTTGDAVFDGALKQALTVQLIQSPFLSILPEQRVRDTLRQMGRSPDEPVNKAVGREICQRVNVKAMLAGSIARLGNQYVIGLDAVNCSSGALLASEQVQTESKEGVLSTLGAAASSLRRKLGESLASIQKYDTPVEEATTSSLEALKSYTLLADDNSNRGKQLEAIPQLNRAIQLDPNFALAYDSLAAIYANLGESERSIEYQKKAYDLRDRVSEQERFVTTATYHWVVTGDLDKETETEESWAQA